MFTPHRVSEGEVSLEHLQLLKIIISCLTLNVKPVIHLCSVSAPAGSP